RAAQRVRDSSRTYPKRGACSSCGEPVYLGGTSARHPKCRACRKRDRCGTENGYRKGCRCDACREANSKAQREYAARKRAEGVDIYAKGREDRRARARRAFVAQVDREAVFERDGWVCQICMERIDRRTKYPH